MTKTDTELMQIRDDLNNGEGMDTEWTQDRLNDVLDSHFDANTEIARLQKELQELHKMDAALDVAKKELEDMK